MAVGDPAKGKVAYESFVCASCHDVDGKGTHGPNITPSLTAGIGTWSYQNFHDAVRSGKDKDGSALCLIMTPVPEKDLSEASMLDLYAYVKSFPVNDTAHQGEYCP